MPYIKAHKRRRIDCDLANLPNMNNSGELNYVLTKIILSYLNQKGCGYSTMNDIVGALDSAKAEFQRRVVAPYEDEKIKENGDVY